MLRLPAPPERVYVRAEFLYDMDPAHVGELVKARLAALVSYPGHALTADIVTDDGAVFSYMPLHALLTRRESLEEQWIKVARVGDCCFHNCPDEYASANVVPALQGDVQLYDRQGCHLRGGRYLTTIDWYTANDLLHVVDAGVLVAWPNHKLLWRADPSPDGLPKYKRLRREWRVSR